MFLDMLLKSIKLHLKYLGFIRICNTAFFLSQEIICNFFKRFPYIHSLGMSCSSEMPERGARREQVSFCLSFGGAGGAKVPFLKCNLFPEREFLFSYQIAFCCLFPD